LNLTDWNGFGKQEEEEEEKGSVWSQGRSDGFYF